MARQQSEVLEHKSLKVELWREYDIPGRDFPYTINNPVELCIRKGGTTHRVLDAAGIVHCVPAPGQGGCVLRWKNKPGKPPFAF